MKNGELIVLGVIGFVGYAIGYKIGKCKIEKKYKGVEDGIITLISQTQELLKIEKKFKIQNEYLKEKIKEFECS